MILIKILITVEEKMDHLSKSYEILNIYGYYPEFLMNICKNFKVSSEFLRILHKYEYLLREMKDSDYSSGDYAWKLVTTEKEVMVN